MKTSVNGYLRYFLKWSLFRSVVLCLDFSYDLLCFVKYANSLYCSTRDRWKIESLLFYYYHKIEKTLAIPVIPHLFGVEYVRRLVRLMETWVRLPGETDSVAFLGACSALRQYRDHVGDSLTRSDPHLARLVDKMLHDHDQGVKNATYGGTMTIDWEVVEAKSQEIGFDELVFRRHSVRTFTSQCVPVSAIRDAVKLAQRSPSVCNRQSGRVHVFTREEDKQQVLRQQNGNEGFGHLANRVLLVTADLRTFVSSSERHQAYVDAGLFAMTLIYALQAQGIASCCLNTSTHFFQEISLRRVCKIPKWEIPIMMIAVGYPPRSFQVAVSARIPTERVLSMRNLEDE